MFRPSLFPRPLVASVLLCVGSFAVLPADSPAQMGQNVSGYAAQGGAPIVSGMPLGTVGLMEVEVPAEERFVLRGTLPLLPGVEPTLGSTAGLWVVEAGGALVPAQVEVVSRYANPEHGADVVEVLAYVRRPMQFAPGSRLRYPVVLGAVAPKPTAPANALAALHQGIEQLPPEVTALITSKEGLQLEARDVFGHLYRLDILGSGVQREVQKYGRYHAQVKFSGVMTPVAPVSGPNGTLAHFPGVNVYLSTWSGEPVLGLDVRVHNAFDGRNPSDPRDDAVGAIYFDKLRLSLKEGHGVLEAFDAPGTGATQVAGGRLHWMLVEPFADNRLHVLPVQFQFHRRLAIAPTGSMERALSMLEGRGLAFARRGLDAVGKPLWSWWNPDTARWFPQRFPLPHLEHVGMVALRDKLHDDFVWVERRYELGTSYGNFPINTPRLGWAHPWGISYGGMTGGTEIHMVDGVREMESASVSGYLRAQLVHLMNSDRQCNALYSVTGRPTRLEDWLQPGSPPFLPFGFYMKPQGPADPFGFKSAPTFQSDAVAQAGRNPDYEAELLVHQPYDLQHLIRYTRLPKLLLWMANDTLAKDDLLMQAELVRMSYHRFPNGNNGYKDSTGMLTDIQHVLDWPGRGMEFGRGESWGVDAVVSAYASGTPAWRADTYGWFFDLAAMLATGVAPCSGQLQALVSNKMLEGKYRAAQSYELSIVHNAIKGVTESIFRGRQEGFTAMLEDLLAMNYWAFVNPLQWNETLNGPKDIYAIGPLDITQGVWCTVAQQPADGFVPTVNTFQTYTTLGYAWQQTKHPFFLQRASEMAGTNPIGKLYASGAVNIENRAGLLYVLQNLLGEL
ncbi:MAG: hypothetical protein GC161_09985 [Planctomycetaceae bacterium]|nr:hypothetical protein [Planctomycetaceae bacterium]